MMTEKILLPLTILIIPLTGVFAIDQYYNNVPKNTLIEGVVGQPTNIHPLKSQENDIEHDLVRLIYRGLAKYDVEGELVPDLAESWEISEDGLEYTIYLKKDIYWQDHEKFTSDDVVFTAKRSASLKDVDIEKIDDYTVKLKLKEKFAPFSDLLSFRIAPEHIDTNKQTLKAVGTGPFGITDITFAGDIVKSITLDRTQRDKSKNKAEDTSINRLIFRFFNDDQELETAAKLRQVDTIAGKPFIWPGYKVYKTPLLGRYYGIFLNVSKKGLLSNVEFRKALARSTPKEMIVKDVFEEKVRIIDGPIQDSWAQEENIEIYNYTQDPQAKYEGEITLVVPKTAEHIQTGKILKDTWSRLGITVYLREVELSEITEKIIKPHDFDALLLGQEVKRDPDRYSLWHSTQIDFPGLNFTGYKQVRVDKALEKGRQTLDREERKKHYSIFQKVLSQDVPVIYLYQPYYYYTVADKVKGLELRNLYVPSDKFNFIDDWEIKTPIEN